MAQPRLYRLAVDRPAPDLQHAAGGEHRRGAERFLHDGPQEIGHDLRGSRRERIRGGIQPLPPLRCGQMPVPQGDGVPRERRDLIGKLSNDGIDEK